MNTSSIEQDIRQITEAVFESVFGLSGVDCPADGDCGIRLGFISRVGITGPADGSVSVTITASVAAARYFAAMMFAAADVDVDDVKDALGEMANLIGGGFKAMMDPPTDLTLPVVAEFEAGPPSVAGKLLFARQFTFGDHAILVQLNQVDSGDGSPDQWSSCANARKDQA